MAAPVGGAFRLVDHHGQTVTEQSFLGRPALLYFGFTRCRLVCPRALTRLSLALAAIAPDALQPLFVSVDPERDTPAVMKAYLDANFPRFLGLTGARADIDAMKTAYKVFARRIADAADPDGYAVSHTAFSYLLGADGGYVTHFADTTDDARIAATLRAEVDR